MVPVLYGTVPVPYSTVPVPYCTEIDDFRKRVGILIMIVAVRIIYRILYEFSIDPGEITKYSELYCNRSIAVDFYRAQMVKHSILNPKP